MSCSSTASMTTLRSSCGPRAGARDEIAPRPGEITASEYRRGRTLGDDEGGGLMVFLVMLVIAVVVVVLVMRAAAAQGGGPGGTGRPARPQRNPRAQRPSRPVAPDDDPEFLRELERRTRRDDGSPA